MIIDEYFQFKIGFIWHEVYLNEMFILFLLFWVKLKLCNK